MLLKWAATQRIRTTADISREELCAQLFQSVLGTNLKLHPAIFNQGNLSTKRTTTVNNDDDDDGQKQKRQEMNANKVKRRPRPTRRSERLAKKKNNYK